MIFFKLKNDTTMSSADATYRLCEALVGSPGFINNEIVVIDSEIDTEAGTMVNNDGIIRVIVGNDNGRDVEVEGTVSSILDIEKKGDKDES